jgi:GAF domain-containing protein/HAMP domain-containing protein
MSSAIDSRSESSARPHFQGHLRNTALLLLLPSIIFFILVMGGVTYLRARSVIQGQINTQLNANLEALTVDFDKWLTTKLIRMDLAVRRPQFIEALNQVIAFQNTGDNNYDATRQVVLDELQAIKEQGEELLFKSFFITLPDGTIIIASQPDWEMQNIADSSFFKILAKEVGSMVVYDPTQSFDEETFVVTSIPFLDNQETPKATVFGLSGSLNLISLLENVTRFNPIADSYLITQSGDFLRIDPYQKTLVLEAPSAQQASEILTRMTEDQQNSTEPQKQVLTLNTFDGTPTIASYSWLPALKAGLVIEMPQEIAFGDLNALGPFTLAVALVLGVILVVAIFIVTRRLINPLLFLANTTEQFAQGNWDLRAPVTRNDEIGLLSHSFNTMAEDLSDLYHTLESQVLERTRSLEKRSQQLETTAQVARQAAAIRDLEVLLSDTTQLISEHFGFYHAGIFLLDPVGKYAVLQAANSEGGRKMLARSHRLEVGQKGVVGYVAASGNPRIALDVGADVYFFDNPDLPNTRSELALPLKIRNQVIGVLDVQSTESGAFEETDVEILQVLADQIGLAIENARLLEQSQEAIQELQQSYGTQLRQGWERWTKEHIKAFHFDRVRVLPATQDQIKTQTEFLSDQPNISNTQNGSILSVPIRLRDQNFGSIILRRSVEEGRWTAEDLTVLSESVIQIAVALENARLLDETKRRAEHEQTVSEVSTLLSRSIDIDSILKTAVRELGKLPNVADVAVHIGAPQGE